MLGLVGVTARETRVAGVTVSVVDADIEPEAAMIVEVPAATAVANPEALTAATPELDELQVTVADRSWVVLSEKVPVAVNCSVVPFAVLGMGGVIARETSVAGVTVSSVEPEIPPNVALIVVLPIALPLACPGLYITDESEETAVASTIVATAGSDEVHVTSAVRSFVVLSE